YVIKTTPIFDLAVFYATVSGSPRIFFLVLNESLWFEHCDESPLQ
ncbi:MAG: hypothetical protein ACI87Q_002894, partial [Pseudohongiellaceae bacterium]